MAVESIRGNLSTTGRLRANLAVGGGSEVTITPTYNSGIKIADYSIDNVPGEIYIPNQTPIHDILWINQGTTNPATITTAHNLSDYDIICITVKRTAYGQSWKLQYMFDFKSGIELNEQFLMACWSNNNEYISYVYSDFNLLSSMQQGNALIITQIEGVKY